MNSDYIKSTLRGNYNPINHVLVMEDENSRQTIILEEANYSMGRDSRNKIVLNSKKVSRFHATLLRRTDTKNRSFSYWLLDGDLQGNRSTNGIFINDKRCLVQELKHEDVIRLGFEVQASYYVLDNMADVALLQSGDFQKSQGIIKTDNGTSGGNRVVRKNQNQVVSENQLSTDLSFGDESIDVQESAAVQVNEVNSEQLASIPELAPNAIIELNWQGDITYLNPSGKRVFPELQSDRYKKNHPMLVNLVKNIGTNGRSRKLFSREVKFKNKIFDQYIHYLAPQKVVRTYIFERNKPKTANYDLPETENKYQKLLKQVSDGVLVIDADSKSVIDVNEPVTDLLGYDRQEICNLKLYDLVDLNSKALDQQISAIIQSREEYTSKQLSFRCRNKLFLDLEANISTFNTATDDKNTNLTYLSIVIRPLSSNNYQETYIQEEGFYNIQTGLPNRPLLMEQLKLGVANSFRNQQLLCLAFLELEILEENGSTLDYRVQSRILEGFAKRLRACLRLGDTICYWESSQFGCLLPQVKSSKDIGRVCNRMLESLKQPFFLDNKKVYTKISIGISLKGKEEKTVENLISEAQTALQKSKKTGSNNYKFASDKLQTETERLLRIEKLLAHALERDEFSLFYQPQIDVKENKITGIEALIRWQHPELGIVRPDQFLPLAEETGLIVSIGEWVVKTACEQRKAWQEDGLNDQPICINISAGQFQQPNFIGMIKGILDKTGLEPNLLEVDIKETTIALDVDLSHKHLSELNELGVKIALDDFGTGVSSFGFLREFQFSTVKIDEVVTNNFSTDPRNKALLKAIINIAESFDLRVIAEAVENKPEVNELLELGCNEVQGNWLTNPLEADKIKDFLQSDEYTI